MDLKVGDRVTSINRDCRGIIKHIDTTKRNALYNIKWLLGPNKGLTTDHLRSKIYFDTHLEELEEE